PGDEVGVAAGLATRCQWACCDAASGWFYQVAWDVGLLAVRPDGRSLAVLAATDTGLTGGEAPGPGAGGGGRPRWSGTPWGRPLWGPRYSTSGAGRRNSLDASRAGEVVVWAPRAERATASAGRCALSPAVPNPRCSASPGLQCPRVGPRPG